MTLQQLNYIVETAKQKSFYKAAEKCFVSQPTLSIQIKKLEDEIGIVIFDREKKPFSITPEGELIISKAKQIINDMETLNSFVKKEHLSLSGTFKIGIIPTLASFMLPILYKNYNIDYKETKLVIQELPTKTLVEKLLNNEIDIGVLVTPLNENHIREIPLFNERFLVYTSKSHPLFKKNKIKKDDLTDDGLLILEEGHCFRNQTLEICNLSKLNENKIKYQSGSIETLMKIIDLNYAYTLIPELSVSNVNSKLIKEFEEPIPVREVSLVVKNTFNRESLLKLLKEQIQAELPSHLKKIEKYFRVNI